jgi:hypothetical protein
MNKQELITRIMGRTPVGTPLEALRQLHTALERSSVEHLEKLEAESLAEILRTDPKIAERERRAYDERVWAYFFLKHPDILDFEGNRKALYNYALSLSNDDKPTPEMLEEAAAKADLLGVQRQKPRQTPTAANLKQDEETFQNFCQANQLEPTIAALNLLRREYGASFASAQIDQALQSGLINLGPVSAETSLQWAEQGGQTRKQLLAGVESYLDPSPESWKIRNWIKDLSVPVGEIRERIDLVEEVAGSLSPHQQDRARDFRRIVLSPYTTIESLRQRVAEIEKRRELNSLSREELRDRARREYEERHPQQPQRITLPAEITAEAIRKSSKDQQLAWHKQYGVDLLNARLRGES